MANLLFKKIRTQFLFSHPFLSVVALSIPTYFQTNEQSAFLSDGNTLFIDTQKLLEYSQEEITYLYAHTLLHIVLKHPSRMGDRDVKVWNLASNIVVNNLLSTFSNVGRAPKDEPIEPQYRDMSVEKLYTILHQQQQTPQKNKQDLRQGTPTQTLDSVIVQALSLAQKSIHQHEGLSVEIDAILKPKVALYEVLKEYFMLSFFEKSLSYALPNKRFRDIYLPSYRHANEALHLLIGLDSSSSVSIEEYRQFLGFIEEIGQHFYEYSVEVLPFDISVKSEYIVRFDSLNPLKHEDILIPKSDGGTSFLAFMEYVQKHYQSVSLLIVLSDGEFDCQRVAFTTLFLLNKKSNLEKFKPYGRVIYLE